MGYSRKIEYVIIPGGAFKVLQNCSGCHCKTTFYSTNRFRVNANGNKIDIWLIYQCEKCKHTYNMTIYERCSIQMITREAYEGFTKNSTDLAFAYGTDQNFFAENRAEVDWSNTLYHIKRKSNLPFEEEQFFHEEDLLIVYNHYAIKVRTDKIVAEILNLTRSEVKRLEKSGLIVLSESRQEHKLSIEIKGDLYNSRRYNRWETK
ncbi:MAG: hypothetical protein PWP51_2455 [Clostridiales bacterium]|jgi:hypothetical protein|nr:hypothetical protein [Clostridiales bacterium]MDN5299902.1 hypothetical protein [Clostridiales bacterium]